MSRDYVASIIDGLHKSDNVIRFYNVLYEYMLCEYRPFLEHAVPASQRAPLPESVRDRLASGNAFEASQLARLIDYSMATSQPYVYLAGTTHSLTTKEISEVREYVTELLRVAPAWRSYGLVADGELTMLTPASQPRFRSKLTAVLRSIPASASRVFVMSFDSYHDMATKAERDAYKADIEHRTVSAMRDGIAAMRAGQPAPILIGPRLPRTYVPSFDADFVGEPDLLVPVAKDIAYTSVDYKDASAFTPSRVERTFDASPALTPAVSEASKQTFAGQLNKKHRLQLYHYHLMLTELHRALDAEPASIAAIIGRQNLAVYADVADYTFGRGKSAKTVAQTYASTVQASLEVDALGRAFVAGNDPLLPVSVAPAKRSVCSDCVFRKQCATERAEISHLTLHPDLGPREAVELAEALPTPTLSALAYSDPDTLTERIISRGVRRFGTNPQDIRAKVQHLIDGARSIKADKAYRRRDQSRVPTLEAVVEVHLDLENNNNPMADGKVPPHHWFQTGWVTKHKKPSPDADGGVEVSTRYHALFTKGTDESEIEMFTQFWQSLLRLRKRADKAYTDLRDHLGNVAFNALKDRVASGDTDALTLAYERHNAETEDELKFALGSAKMAGIVPFRVFVYSDAERRIMSAKARQYAGVEGIPSVEELNEWFTPSRKGRPESAVAVDLLAFIKTYLHIPRMNRSLKTVAPYVGHYWEAEDPNGLAATYKASTMFSHPDPDERDAAREWLWKYNKDDCLANFAIRVWIDSVNFKGVEQLDTEGVFAMRLPRRATRKVTQPQEMTLF